MRKFIGFYWTLPVPWAGFTELPKDPAEAARRSKTIRYQRERIRRWVKDEQGDLIHEEVFLELEPDRGSEQIGPLIDRLLDQCRNENAALVLVDFSEAFGWRRHGPLLDRIEEDEGLCVWLDPAEEQLDGQSFNPVEHFRTWRDIRHSHAATKPERAAAIAAAIERLSDDQRTFAQLAEALNAEGIRTVTGKCWTGENLRKFVKAL